MSTQNTPVTAANNYSAFLPVCLLALSLMIILVWQITLAGQQYINLQKVEEQQAVLTQQAADTESKLKALMMDVVELAKTNPEARSIVKKHNIKMNNPPAK